MSCYHPLKGFPIGLTINGKPDYKITSYECEKVINVNGVWKECYSNLMTDYGYKQVSDFIEIPCGHCIGCLLDRSRQWADRCMLEAKYHEKNCFITLTYDEDHINSLSNYDYVDSDGCINKSPFYSLDKVHLQKFFKRLRKRLDKDDIKIRYFACGEYGSKTYRPHFHAIIFGYDFDADRVLYKSNFRGDRLYNSPLLQSCWPYGFAVVADCTWDTCAYVARYCLKKRDNDLTEFYNTFGLDPEFVVMSRKPGIARQYYDDNRNDIYRFETIYIGDKDGSHRIRPPRYYDKLYDLECPDDFKRIKDKRYAAALQRKSDILDRTDLEYLDYLKVAEYNHEKKTKIFKERSVEK